MNKILVLAVHPDDETLGCGGTLLKHKSLKDKIYWLICTNISEEYGFEKQIVLARQKEIALVKKTYKFDNVYNLDIPTMKVDTISMNDLITKISKIFYEIQPDILYLPFYGDVHSDHRKLFHAAFSCTKTFRYPFIKKILMMETISETEFAPGLKEFGFIPNYFVNINDFFDKKLDIIKIFHKELGEHPFPRSLKNIKALATFRGAMADCNYAESFMILKEIW